MKRVEDMTIGERIVRHQRGENVTVPSVEEAKKLPLNRADRRASMRHFMPRALRRETFGAYRDRGRPEPPR